MKILLYTANFAPEPTGIGKYSGEMAAWLVSQGHDVRVVAAPPYYPAWQIAKGYAWPPYRREKWHGVDVWRAPLWVPRKPNGIKRMLHLATFALSSLPVMLWQIMWRPNVVMTVAPALVCSPTGWLVAKLSGGKSWLHIQDFEVDVAFQMNFLKGKQLESIILRAERWLFSWFDVVSSISNNMLDKLRLKGVVEGRVRFLPNWVDIAHIRPLNEISQYRQEMGIAAHTKVVLFSGTLNGKQGLMVIPEAARRLINRSDILFIVCGDGIAKPQLEAACKGLSNVRFMPLQPFERLGQLLGLADIHLLPQSPEAADLVLPSKLSGMLASGLPIIATCRQDTEVASVVSKCGLVVPPEDSFALATAIEQLVNNDAQRLHLGVQARIYSEQNLARDSVLGRLLEQFTLTTLTTKPQPITISDMFSWLYTKFTWLVPQLPTNTKIIVLDIKQDINNMQHELPSTLASSNEVVESLVSSNLAVNTCRNKFGVSNAGLQYIADAQYIHTQSVIPKIRSVSLKDTGSLQAQFSFDLISPLELDKSRKHQISLD